MRIVRLRDPRDQDVDRDLFRLLSLAAPEQGIAKERLCSNPPTHRSPRKNVTRISTTPRGVTSQRIDPRRFIFPEQNTRFMARSWPSFDPSAPARASPRAPARGFGNEEPDPPSKSFRCRAETGCTSAYPRRDADTRTARSIAPGSCLPYRYSPRPTRPRSMLSETVVRAVRVDVNINCY